MDVINGSSFEHLEPNISEMSSEDMICLLDE